jgi:hypothetical protein
MKTVTPLPVAKTKIDANGIYRWTRGSTAAKKRLIASLATSIGVLDQQKRLHLVPSTTTYIQDQRRRLALVRAEHRLLTDQGGE